MEIAPPCWSSGREWNELSNLKDDAEAMFDNSSVLITRSSNITISTSCSFQ
jgi:hypothetical protein